MSAPYNTVRLIHKKDPFTDTGSYNPVHFMVRKIMVNVEMKSRKYADVNRRLRL